jgi:hypothetical protein
MSSFEKAEDSGFGDQICCAKCGGTLTIIRFTPHLESGVDYELQTFGCRECTELTNRRRAATRYTGL